LAPELSDSAALYVGPLVSKLVDGPLSSYVAAQVGALLEACYTRLAVAKLPTMKKEMLIVFIRLFRSAHDSVVQWLAGVQGDGRCVIEGTPSETGLHYVLGMWALWHAELEGAFVTKMSASVLTQLIGTELGEIPVPGKEIQQQQQGPRRSRRQAARTGNNVVVQWTWVPLRVKVIQLLASNYRDALLQDLSQGVPDAIADEFEDIDDDDDDELDSSVDSDDVNADYYRMLSQFDDDDDDPLNDDREEVDDPDIVNDELYQLNFAKFLESFFASLANSAPELLAQCAEAALLNAQQQRDIQSAIEKAAQ